MQGKSILTFTLCATRSPDKQTNIIRTVSTRDIGLNKYKWTDKHKQVQMKRENFEQKTTDREISINKCR